MKSHNLDKKYLFDIIIDKTKELSVKESISTDAAFQKWFMNMYFQNPKDIIISDGSRDGKIDSFCKVMDVDTFSSKIFNSKFTKNYDKQAPPEFYNEIIAFNKVFVNSDSRSKFLEKYIKKDMKNHYKILFDQFDKGNAELFFITNYRINHNQYSQVEDLEINIFHLEDILQFLVDDIEGAMPLTNTLVLTGINNVLSASKEDTVIPTSIIFAKLSDFISYMNNDPYDLLFSRNIRLDLGNTDPNKNIRETFRDSPKEFVFSNNGITIICEEIKHKPGNQELLLKNPRVVNGSQTLHSVRHVPNPSKDARVMVRIIEIPPFQNNGFSEEARKRKEIINKISIRSNLQNPITKWNLAANDDYQQELRRYFRQKNFFYETRKNEWDFRKTQLRNVEVFRGPFMPKLIQLIASYYFNEKYLGPAVAKQSVNDLFVEDKAYAKIVDTDPAIVYQIFLLNQFIGYSLYELKNLQYINNIKQHARLSIFALYVKIINELGDYWGTKDFNEILESYYYDYDGSLWKKITKSIITDIILPTYEKERKRYKKMEGTDLSYNTYFKNQTFMNNLMLASCPVQIKSSLRKLLNEYAS